MGQTPPSETGTRMKSGALYTLATAIPRFASFLLIPLYIRILSPSEYGELSVALSVVAFAVIVFGLGFEVMVFRNVFAYPGQSRERTNYIGSTWVFLGLSSFALAAVLSVVFLPFIGDGDVLTRTQLVLSLLCAATTVTATTVPLATLRAEDRAMKYLAVNLLNAGTAIVLTLLLVAVAKLGVNGWLIAVLIGNLIGLVASIVLVPFKFPDPFDGQRVRATLRESIHVVPHFASMWSLQLVDRLLVASLISTAAAGVYSLASNIALPMYVLVLGFGQAFMPDYARAGTDSESRKALRGTIQFQVGFVCVLAIWCALLLGPVLHLISDPGFEGSVELVPWIVLGYALMGLYAIPMNGVTLVHGKTSGIFLISAAGAATNVGLIVFTAERYGLEAVAIAAALGYLVLLLAVLLFAAVRRATLDYPIARIGAMIVIALVSYGVAVAIAGGYGTVDTIIRSVVAAAGSLLIAAVGGLYSHAKPRFSNFDFLGLFGNQSRAD